MRMTSIIIPVHDSHRFTLACIDSIRENTRDYEIIVVDNGSMLPFSVLGDDVRVIRNDDNRGYAAAVNQAVAAASGDVFAFLNNDVLVTPHWMECLMWHLDNGIDLVGPRSNSVAGPQWVPPRNVGYRYVDGMLGSIDKGEFYRFAANFHIEQPRKAVRCYRLVLYCLVLRRSAVDRIGPFCEDFTLGTFEDDDYCLRAIEVGYRLGIAQDVFIHHWGGITTKAIDIDMKGLFQKNAAIFNAKWPVDKYEELKRRAVA